MGEDRSYMSGVGKKELSRVHQVVASDLAGVPERQPSVIDVQEFQHVPGVKYVFDPDTGAHHVSTTRNLIELLSKSEASTVILPDIITVDELFILCVSFIAINAPGRAIGIKTATIETDTSRYQIVFNCVVDESEQNLGYETAIMGLGVSGMVMLSDIAASSQTRVRYEGTKMNMTFLMNAAQREELGRFLKLYIQAGGTRQDLTLIEEKESIAYRRNPATRWL